MGMVSHYISDLNWHGLDVVPAPQGFIEQLGVTNYNCSGDLDCHVARRTRPRTSVASSCRPGSWTSASSCLTVSRVVDDLVKIFAYANATAPDADACYGGGVCPRWSRSGSRTARTSSASARGRSRNSAPSSGPSGNRRR